ncbi:MAG: SpoIIE family protein phosphatase [Salinivirgaceae bacterium]|nr:SpoIIE family protein phosphatase [Salinivirgaceae bacterium]
MHYLKFVIVVAFLLSCCNVLSASEKATIKKGILDLKGQDINNLKDIEFSGDWEFYWNQLLTPSDFSKNTVAMSKYVPVPSVWNSFEINGENLPRFGAATYRMHILVDYPSPELAIKLGSIGTAFRLIVDGKEIRSAGNVSLVNDGAVPGYHPGVVTFKPSSDTVEVIFQISNYHYSKGGLWNNYSKIGSANHILKSWNREIQLSLVLIGCIFIFALYHLGLYFLNRNFRYTLYFSLFCLTVIVRTLVVNEIFVLDLFPNFNWIVLIKLEYFTIPAGIIFFSLFIYKFFIEEYSYKFLKLIVALNSIAAIMVLLTPPSFFTKQLLVIQLNIILAAVYIIVVVIKALIRKKPSAFILLIGFLVLMFTVVNDILYSNKVINTMFLTSFGFLFFIFSQAYMLSARFSSLFVRTESLAKRLEATNENLEKLVEKRTSKIQEQNGLLIEKGNVIQIKNDELEQVNDEIKSQRDNLQMQNEIVSRQKKQITSSIEYASRIQSAVIDTANEIDAVAPDSFILFHPKDIVSGDFYWFKEIKLNGKKIKLFTVVDCTGHGVPGAFMSILGALFLNKIVTEFKHEIKASEILNKMRNEVKALLQQNAGTKLVKDGMNMALGIIDCETMKIQFAGAHNPLYIIRNINGTPATNIEEYKGDRMPIGIYIKEKESFTNHVIDVSKGDLVYLFSDGYYDQFGGENGSKFNKKNFRATLLKNAHLPLSRQKLMLDQVLFQWRGNHEQIDDITVIGLRV